MPLSGTELRPAAINFLCYCPLDESHASDLWSVEGTGECEFNLCLDWSSVIDALLHTITAKGL